MSVRSWRWTSLHLPQNPRIAARVLLKRANWDMSLCNVITDAYGSLHFSAIFSASILFTLLHSGAIPPIVMKTRSLNEDFSISITLWLYFSLRERDVQTKPTLLPINENDYQRKVKTADNARLDISARGLWNSCEKTFFDIRITHPTSQSYSGKSLAEVYQQHEKEKCGFGLNIPLSLSVPKSLSLSCASLKCSHLVCIWGCDPQSLSLHKHSEWVCLSPSIDLMQIA